MEGLSAIMSRYTPAAAAASNGSTPIVAAKRHPIRLLLSGIRHWTWGAVRILGVWLGLTLLLFVPPSLINATPARSGWWFAAWFLLCGSLDRKVRSRVALRSGVSNPGAGGDLRRTSARGFDVGENAALAPDGSIVAVTPAADTLRRAVLPLPDGAGPIAKRGPDRLVIRTRRSA